VAATTRNGSPPTCAGARSTSPGARGPVREAGTWRSVIDGDDARVTSPLTTTASKSARRWNSREQRVELAQRQPLGGGEGDELALLPGLGLETLDPVLTHEEVAGQAEDRGGDGGDGDEGGCQPGPERTHHRPPGAGLSPAPTGTRAAGWW
jgi:hypothetical protein